MALLSTVLFALALLLQAAAAATVVLLARRAGARLAGGLLGLAILLLGLAHLLAGDTSLDAASALLREALASATAALLLGGVLALGAWLASTRRAAAEQVRAGAEEIERLGRRQRLILDSAGEGAVSLDRAGRVTLANRAAQQMLGFEEAEFRGRSFHDLVHHTRSDGRPYPESECPLAALVREGAGFSGEDLFWSHSGQMVPVECVAAPLHDGLSREGALLVFRDVRARREAERALRESEARLRHIYENAPVMIHTVDAEGRICDVNDRWLSETGYQREEILGWPALSVIDGPPPHDDCLFGHREGQSQGRRHVETRYRRRDGSRIEVVLDYVTTNDPSGRRICLVVGRNVTDQRRLEAQLRKHQRAEAVGHFASGIAHDFNNLIQIVSGTVELLQMQHEAQDPRQEDLGTIRRAADRGTELVRNLMAFSRRQVVQPIDVDLAAQIDALVPMLRRVIPENIEIRCAQDGGRVTAHVDPVQIEQALMNLCVNARDAMPKGGVLHLRAGVETVGAAFAATRSWARPGTYAVLEVADTGSGMTPNVQERIFEPFFTTKEEGRGAGLGLATVYGVVKQHGGMLDVLSAPGQGSTFTVYLPLARGRTHEHTASRPRDETKRGTESVLIVEDQPELCALAGRMLARLGYRVRGVTSGTEALRLITEGTHPVDVVMADVIMPGMGGVELFRRARELRPELAFVFSSGYSDGPADPEIDLPVDPLTVFVPKPFSAESLSAKIREALARGGPRPAAHHAGNANAEQ